MSPQERRALSARVAEAIKGVIGEDEEVAWQCLLMFQVDEDTAEPEMVGNIDDEALPTILRWLADEHEQGNATEEELPTKADLQ